MEMPKLSEDLSPATDLDACQSCGGVADRPWREHDDADQPTGVFVLLCKACADRIIEPHPRLYSRLHEHEPAPGVMPCCAACTYRRGAGCGHPDLMANGGPGLPLHFPQPQTAHVLYNDKRGHRRGRWQNIFTGPVTCPGRQE